ncbi:MAG: PilZ domain-containing protein [Candidatus Omnitrophica bacterium]|nr:PilZ domain-containing protein [Candidatus Omnitrophota bacterium]
MIERRRFVRFDTVMNVLCEIGRNIKRTYEIGNISKEGALLLLDTPLNQGSELNLSVDVPGDNVPIFVSCSVAWQKESMVRPFDKNSGSNPEQCRRIQQGSSTGSLPLELSRAKSRGSPSIPSRVEESIVEPKRKIYETGVKFTKIDSFDKGRFLEYIYSQWLKLLERT